MSSLPKQRLLPGSKSNTAHSSGDRSGANSGPATATSSHGTITSSAAQSKVSITTANNGTSDPAANHLLPTFKKTRKISYAATKAMLDGQWAGLAERKIIIPAGIDGKTGEILGEISHLLGVVVGAVTDQTRRGEGAKASCPKACDPGSSQGKVGDFCGEVWEERNE